jgi:hypothetical protein
MQTNRRAQVLVVALAIVAALVAACSPDGTIAVSLGTGPLLTVETRGGECLNAPCGSTVTIERDGTVHSAAKPPNDLGTIPPDQLTALDAAIKTTDFAVLMNRPFTGECPTAFDGQEYIFEFGAPGGTQRMASCEVEVDFRSPLFIAVVTALAPFVPFPIID